MKQAKNIKTSIVEKGIWDRKKASERQKTPTPVFSGYFLSSHEKKEFAVLKSGTNVTLRAGEGAPATPERGEDGCS